jgi:hypothetical protein
VPTGNPTTVTGSSGDGQDESCFEEVPRHGARHDHARVLVASSIRELTVAFVSTWPMVRPLWLFTAMSARQTAFAISFRISEGILRLSFIGSI